MKKSTLFHAALITIMSISAFPVKAQDIASASKTVYDFSGWNDRNMLQLFAKAADEGRTCPTKEEFEAAGIFMDLEFSRSHTRYQPIIEQSSEMNLISSVSPKRRIWMNLPTGSGKVTGGYPTDEFNSDVYSMWNYTHIFGAWNHGFMQAPGCWTAAAHKNGTYMYSGIEFFDYASGSQSQYSSFITEKKEDGSYKYLDAVLNCLIFLGQDGINYNFEQGLPSLELCKFHSALYKRAAEIGFDSFHIGAYTNTNSLSSGNAYLLLGSNSYTPAGSSEPIGKVHDAFLNYSGGDFNWSGVSGSLAAAKSAMGTAEDVYQGVWIVSMDRNWIGMNQSTTKEMNMCLWGEHAVSRFFQFNVGSSVMNAQENYQILQDRTTGGGNRNVLNRPSIKNTGHNFQVMADQVNTQMATWAGFASMAPERSSIQGNLPFNTYFCLGNGDIYFYKGKKTNGSWYNMGQQDYVPTYRWLITSPGNMSTNTTDANLDVRFSHEEAYIGGSSIRISGNATGSDIVIYKTNLNVNGAVTATVALKNMAEAASDTHLSLILQKQDGTWVETPYGNSKGRAWEEKKLNVNGLNAGDVIKHIGVRISGASDDYKLYLGQIRLEDGSAKKAPASIKEDSFIAEVKKENTKSLSVKLNWAIDPTGINAQFAAQEMIYNDEANIDHFEIFLKNGENGKAYEVSRTSGWHAFVGGIDLEKFADPFIGVRSVSTDLVSTSPVVWIGIERYNDPSALPEPSEDLYMPAYMDPTSDGLENAYKYRWIEEVTTTGATGNINYTRTEPAGAWDDDKKSPVEGNTNYVMAEDVLTVKQGETVTMTIRGHNGTDDIRYCMFKGFIDWDIDHEFDGSNDELVWNFGTVNYGAGIKTDYSITLNRDLFVTKGNTFTINVPADAVPGDSRFRIVGCDAWFAGGLNATGAFNKGYALDIPVKIISAGNTPRKPAINYLSFRDEGEPDDVLAGIEDITIDRETTVSNVKVIDKTATFTNTEKAWIYDINGRCVKFVADASSTVSLNDLASGVYIVKMLNKQVIRSSKVVIR